jgi:hypothetical protein
MLGVRVAAGLAVAGPLAAGAASLVVARMNPTYDPIHKSVSRLASIGAPGGNEMDAAIAFLGVSLIAMTIAMRWGRRDGLPAVAVLVAGASFVGAAIIRLDPANPATALPHRALTAVALLGLTLAPLSVWLSQPRLKSDSTYRRASGLIGLLALIGLVFAAGLQFEGFPGGLWERAMAGLTLGWIELTAVRLLLARGSQGR